MKSQTTLESIFIYADSTVTTKVVAKILELGINLTEILFFSPSNGIDMNTNSKILNLANNRVKVRMFLSRKIGVKKTILNKNRKWLCISSAQDYFK